MAPGPSEQALAREDLVTNIPVENVPPMNWFGSIDNAGTSKPISAWKQSLQMRKALPRITSRPNLHASILAR
jgi:hypothetical protein